MFQIVGFVTQKSPKYYSWILSNKKSFMCENSWYWKSPDFKALHNHWCFFLDRITMQFSLCHHRSRRLLSLDVNIIIKNSGGRTVEEYSLKNITRRMQSRVLDYNQYVLEKIEEDNPLIISCIFSRIKAIDPAVGLKGKRVEENYEEETDDEDEVNDVQEQETTATGDIDSLSTALETCRKSIPGPIPSTELIEILHFLLGKYDGQLSENENDTGTHDRTDEASGDETKTESTNIRGLVALSENMKDLFLSEEDCDVTIKVRTQKYPAHKVILRARSPVFSAMLKCDTTEENSGIVDISDCHPYIFRDFLHYLYSGRLDNISIENVFDLFQMSDKYEVNELRMDCVEFMLRNVTVDAFGEAISVAVKHSESELLERATEFFISHATEIFPTEKWLKFIEDNPLEANELLTEAALQRSISLQTRMEKMP